VRSNGNAWLATSLKRQIELYTPALEYALHLQGFAGVFIFQCLRFGGH
jgi:hypothetical protein